MANIVVGVFDEYANAEAARDELIAAGVAESQIRITHRERPRQEHEHHEHSAFWDNIRDYFGIDDEEDDEPADLEASEASEAPEAPEARLLGGAVMTVIAQSHTLDTIVDIIQRHEPEDGGQRSRIEADPNAGETAG